MKYNSFKFHAFIKVRFLFTECSFNVILYYRASEASPTLGCSIEILRDQRVR